MKDYLQVFGTPEVSYMIVNVVIITVFPNLLYGKLEMRPNVSENVFVLTNGGMFNLTLT